MAAYKGPASSRPRYTRGGSSVAAIPVQSSPVYVMLPGRDLLTFPRSVVSFFLNYTIRFYHSLLVGC
jgi:hypothetical protein